MAIHTTTTIRKTRGRDHQFIDRTKSKTVPNHAGSRDLPMKDHIMIQLLLLLFRGARALWMVWLLGSCYPCLLVQIMSNNNNNNWIYGRHDRRQVASSSWDSLQPYKLIQCFSHLLYSGCRGPCSPLKRTTTMRSTPTSDQYMKMGKTQADI